MGILKKIIGRIRTYKPAYIIYNFFHQRELAHNKDLYKKLHIHKPVYWTVSSEDFANLPQHSPWLDEPDAREKILADAQFNQMHADLQHKILHWIDNGFIIWENFLSEQEVGQLNKEIDDLLLQKKIQPLENGKIMFAHKQSAYINKIISDERIMQLFAFIFRQPVIAFQTINFIKGSQQRAHSDSVHMTTYPLGYLSASWFALEDIDADNGSLFYYPGSHRLPYILSPQFDKTAHSLKLNENAYDNYENTIQSVIDQQHLVKEDFHARKGDLFLWHANLIHGGNAILDPSRTRKSMVVHYFAKDVIKYHEISKRPALLNREI